METDLTDVAEGMNTESALAEGLRLLQESTFSGSTKSTYCRGWRLWVSWCGDAGVDPLSASWEDFLGFWRSFGGRRIGYARNCSAAVGFVYRSRGEASPTHDRRLAGVYGNKRHASLESFSDHTRLSHLSYRSDYLAWCRFRGVDPAPASAEHLVGFLSSLGDCLTRGARRAASAAVSIYLTELGHPPLESHPLVVAAVKREPKVKGSSACGGGDGKPLADRAARYKRHWDTWRDGEGIVPGAATGADVVNHLRNYEHQPSADARAISLRNFCGGEEPAFRSDEVRAWVENFRVRLERGEVPGRPTPSRVEPVLAEWSAARAARAKVDLRVPVGLTREEVEMMRLEEARHLEAATKKTYAYTWAKFTDWREGAGRRIPLESVEALHVRAYLKESAERLAVSSLWHMVDGLAYGFEQHGFLNNPAYGDAAINYVSDLALERKESSPQMDPIREADFNVLLGSAFDPRPFERASRAELRKEFVLSLVRVMFDGLLRGGEAARARWGHLSRSAENGSGSLLLPHSKVDQLGKGEVVYVSPVSFEHLELLRDLRRFHGEGTRKDDLIFGLAVVSLWRVIREACADAGLVGRFGTHSMRIGAAQELALRGYSLPMIMLAGRWASPDEVYRYIKHIKVQESAMADLQRLLLTDQYRLGPDARGIDVMSNYDLVKRVR